MTLRSGVTRREFLRLVQAGALLSPLAWLPTCSKPKSSSGKPPTLSDDQLLDEIERTSFDFFWNEASSTTGQVKDRALANGGDARTMSSIAATGFGLTALCIADSRNFHPSAEIKERVRITLKFLANQMPHEHGFFYHFVDMNTGSRIDSCELSSVDTSILLSGVLTARQYFSDAEIQDLATSIYNRVDWQWMLNGGSTLCMGWKPESSFLEGRWNHYCELMMIYLLAIGSTTHPIPPETWEAWSRPIINYQGIEYISGNDPLFTHQYSHAWFDFRNQRDKHADYFLNSVKATRAHKLFCLSLKQQFSDYSQDLWGISASDSAAGYTAWGGPPALGNIDGSIVPCAVGGSLPFLFKDCMRVLQTIRNQYGNRAWTRYSFVDAFNPLTGWNDSDVLGIDLGITMLMAENQRTGLVWQTFMKNSEAQSAMQKVGFTKT